ncbi:unnamed protein product [Spirodela intermedia]|uniref:Uncharacterized protein n=1 Tax=Spirodela intermedia TaxID=51605 RepID=A0A7I8IGN2_SPIIN|nr:unnamed protein product [Spirodela intermedia]CAA6656951.1 unnamed protein product [Spirodela intermedia]
MEEQRKSPRALATLFLLLLLLESSSSSAAARVWLGSGWSKRRRGNSASFSPAEFAENMKTETGSLLPPRRLLPRWRPPLSGPSKGGNEVRN